MLWKILGIVSKGDYSYAIVPDHPAATKNGYVLEHRVVMENKLDRLLLSNELVHHKNEIKKDNDPDNLVIKLRGVHEREHGLARGRQWVDLICPGCEKSFDRPRGATFLLATGRGSFSCCSIRCRGVFSKMIQMKDPRTTERLLKNVVRTYRKYR